MPEINMFLRDVMGGDYVITQSKEGNWQKPDGTWYYHDSKGNKTEHGGTDIRARKPVPIYAPFGGLVAWKENPAGYGHYMTITKFVGKDKYEFLAAHLSERFPENNSVVKYKDKIAMTGNSGGMTTAPHLHLELRKNGVKQDIETFEFSIFNVEVIDPTIDACWDNWGVPSRLVDGFEKDEVMTCGKFIKMLNRFAKNNNLK